MGADRSVEFHADAPIGERRLRRSCDALLDAGGEYVGNEPLDVIFESTDSDSVLSLVFQFDGTRPFQCDVHAIPDSRRLTVGCPNDAEFLTLLDVVNVCTAVFERGDFEFGRLYSEYDDSIDRVTEAAFSIRSPALFYGPELVAEAGRSRLLNAPGLASAETSNGGVVLLTSPSVFGSDVPLQRYLADECAIPRCDTGRIPRADPSPGLDDDVFGLLTHLDGWGAEAAYPYVEREGPRAVEWLTDRLDADGPRVRASAMTTLSLLRRQNTDYADYSFGQPRIDAVDWLLTPLLADSNANVRTAAAKSLSPNEVDDCFESLFEPLRSDPSADVRAAVACALRPAADARAVRELGIALRDDPDPVVRAAAADALGRSYYDIADGELATVAHRVYEADSSPRVRAAVLWMARDELSLSFVLTVVESETGLVRETAVDILAEGATVIRRHPAIRGADNFRGGVRHHLDRVAALLGDSEPVVQTTAALALAATASDDAETRGELAQLIDEETDAKRRAGLRWALELARAERPTDDDGHYWEPDDSEWPHEVGYRRRLLSCSGWK